MLIILILIITSDAPNSGIIFHDNNKKYFRNQIVNFTAEFEESFPPWDSITWKINNEDVYETQFSNVKY